MRTDDDSLTILLVEDDPGHARLIEKNLRRNQVTNAIVTLHDGRQAVSYIFREDPFEHAPKPALVLLDLNLPKLNGYKVLERMKGDERTRHIPVVVLTTTDDSREIQKCYDLGCNIYITKPVDYDQFTQAMHKIGMFLSILQVPSGV